MASWQCDFLLAPRAELSAPGRALTEWIPGASVERTLWWRRAAPARDPASLAARLLPAATSWAPSLVTFGREDGDRIDIWRERGLVQSILVRVDLRLRDARFASGVVDLARALDAVLLRRDGLVVPAEPAALDAALASSPAARFVADPAAYMRRVALGGPEDG